MASIVEGNLTGEFFDEERGLFVDAPVDGKKSKVTGEDGQGMICLELATSDQAR